MKLSQEPAAAQPTIIIWPEAAPPFLLSRAPVALNQIAALTARGSLLMTGPFAGNAGRGEASYYNSFYIFGRAGAASDL